MNMILPEGFNESDIDSLRDKVIHQKNVGIDHVESKRERKRSQMAKLLPEAQKGTIKVHKVWRNLNLRKALFLRDEENIKIVQESGPIGQVIAENANKVIKYDAIDMDFRQDKEQIITDDGMFGLAGVMIDGYDEVEEQPIRTIINPLTCYGDPKAWNTSKMEFFGTEVYKNMYELEESETFFNTDALKNEYSEALKDFEQARDSANNTRHFTSEILNEYKNSGRVAVVNHITSFTGKLYLTSWSASCRTLIRIIEIRDLTNKERKRPDKIDLGVTLYRAKPIPYSLFGASLFDEIEQNQDLATILMYLMVEQSKRNALGPNKYVNSGLGLDLDDLQNKPLSGGIIEYTPDMQNQNLNPQNGIFVEPNEPVSQFPSQMLQMNDSLMDETLGYSSNQVFGISQGGAQTKAEVQTLQQNINEQLGLIADNYNESTKQYIKDHLNCYSANMRKTAKKKVTLFESEVYDSYTLKKADFVPDGKIQVYITSKVQQDIRDKQDFPVLQVIYGQVIQNLEKDSARYNEFTRMLIDKGGVEGLRGSDIIGYNKVERKATLLIEVINRDLYNKETYGPEEGEDFDFILNKIQSSIDNDSKTKAITDYEVMREQLDELQGPQMQQLAQGNAQSTSMGANMLASQNGQENNIPSLQQV